MLPRFYFSNSFFPFEYKGDILFRILLAADVLIIARHYEADLNTSATEIACTDRNTKDIADRSNDKVRGGVEYNSVNDGVLKIGMNNCIDHIDRNLTKIGWHLRMSIIE